MSPMGSLQCGTLWLCLSLSLSSLFLSVLYVLSSLPFLSVSDIVELDVPVRRVGGHDNPLGPNPT